MLSFGVFVLLCVIAGTHAFGNGAPNTTPVDNACTTGDLRPKHVNNSTKRLFFPSRNYDRFPFRLELQSRNVTYRPRGPPIILTLKTINPTRKFKGFVISADAEDAKMGVTGRYEPVGRDRALAKRVNYCGEAITHTNNRLKSSVTVKWNPPAEYTHGRIQFKATVVESFNKFYTGILSDPVDAHIDRNIDTQSIHMQKKFQRMMQGGPGGRNQMLGSIMSQMTNMFPGGMQGGGGGGGQGGRMPAGLPQMPALPSNMQQLLG